MARSSTIPLACVMAGCTAAVSWHAQRGSSRPLLRVHDESLTPPSDSPTGAGKPASVPTLQDAAALALVRNPELAEYSWQVRANEAGVFQATARPNPEASVYVEDVLGTGRFRAARHAQVTLQLSQAIELGEKSAARIVELGQGIVDATVRRVKAGAGSALFGLSVPLPVNDGSQGRRGEAGALLSKTEEAGRTTDVRLRTPSQEDEAVVR